LDCVQNSFLQIKPGLIDICFTLNKINMTRLFFGRMIIALLAFLSCTQTYASGKKDKTATLISQTGIYKGYSSAQYKGYKYSSCYVPMRDSILLAVDVFLPKKLEAGKKIPTIGYLDRYVRSVEAKWPFNWLKDPIEASVIEQEIKFFTSYGYAIVVVDVRGTGASQGKRRMEFSPEEVLDGRDMVDWIIAQPWSDRNVGTTGVSYLGTTAEMLLANQHPAVKACIPRSAIFDLYNDLAFPGGVCQGPFIDIWGFTTRALDDNNYSVLGKLAKLVKGVHPVKSDKHRVIYKQVVAEHKKNYNVSKGVDGLSYRDEPDTVVKASLNDFSVHTRLSQVEGSHTPIYRIGGWYDGALAKGALDAALNTTNTRKVLIGPWDHGPRNNASPYSNTKKVTFSVYTEMLRFFDHYLKGIKNGIDEEPVFTYYSVGPEIWKTSATWPPKEQHGVKMFLSANKEVVSSSSKIKNGTLSYAVDYTATTGLSSRWNSVTTLYKHGPTNYPDRKKEDEKLLSFTSDKLSAATDIAGNPVVHLNFSADANDATVFCYIEDVGPDSSVTYVTEGMFRPLQRKLSNDVYKTLYPNHTYKKDDGQPYKNGEVVPLTFDLLPISYQFKAGHRIRISIAGADAGHFNLPKDKPANFQIITTADNAAYIELPVVNE
jgi:putative CocE/NonD family hydrolase